MPQFTRDTQPQTGVMSYNEWIKRGRPGRRRSAAHEQQAPQPQPQPQPAPPPQQQPYAPPPPPARPAQPYVRTTAPVRHRTARRSSNAYEGFKRIFPTLLLILGCVAMWWAGAKFTVDALRLAFGGLWGYHLAYWIIPIGLTTYEMAYIPIIKTHDSLRIWLWLFIAGFDIGTTVYGMQPWLATQPIGQWSHTFPQVVMGEWILVIHSSWVLAAIIGSIFALATEPLAHRLWQTR